MHPLAVILASLLRCPIPCRLRCGDYGSCSDRLPYCCRGVCQAEQCK